MPPPSPPADSGLSVPYAPAVLLITMLAVTVKGPEAKMPPPLPPLAAASSGRG